jgi:hypothetical protein
MNVRQGSGVGIAAGDGAGRRTVRRQAASTLSRVVRGALAALLLVAGCASGRGGGSSVCEPGTTSPCVCPSGASGEQACLGDGSGYGLCGGCGGVGCAPGATRSCACGDGSTGSQLCLSDGAYGSCGGCSVGACSPSSPAGSCPTGETCASGACCPTACVTGSTCCPSGSECAKQNAGGGGYQCFKQCATSSDCSSVPGAPCCAALETGGALVLDHGICTNDTFGCRCAVTTSDCGGGGECAPFLAKDGTTPKAFDVCVPNDGGHYHGCAGSTSCSTASDCCVHDANGNAFCAEACTVDSMCGAGHCTSSYSVAFVSTCSSGTMTCSP